MRGSVLPKLCAGARAGGGGAGESQLWVVRSVVLVMQEATSDILCAHARGGGWEGGETLS